MAQHSNNTQGKVLYLKNLFESSLDSSWIENLCNQFPTANTEFLTDQCISRLQQLHADEHGTGADSPLPPALPPQLSHHDSFALNLSSRLSPQQSSFLFPDKLDEDDDCFMLDEVTDQGPSLSVLSSIPKDLAKWFQSFIDTLSVNFHPGLLEILMHLEMVKYNTSFSENNADNSHSALIGASETIIAQLSRLDENFNDPNCRMFSKSESKFKTMFKDIPGSETLLTYAGWTLIETDQSHNDDLYVYDEENDHEYLKAILDVLKTYRDYLQNKPIKAIPRSNKQRPHKQQKLLSQSHSKAINNSNSILAQAASQSDEDSLHHSDDDVLNDLDDEKELVETIRDTPETELKNLHATAQDSVAEWEQTAPANLEFAVQQLDLPTHLDVDEYLLRERAMIYGDDSASNQQQPHVSTHQWPSKVPGYALMTEHKRNNVDVYTYSWDEFPHHRYKYLAMECVMNKFARINLSIQLKDCPFDNIKSESALGDVQIFQESEHSNQVWTEVGPYEKKLIFTAHYPSSLQLLYSWRYSPLNVSLKDITEYIQKSNQMLTQAADKMLKLYQTMQLHKVADSIPTLHHILVRKLNVRCFIDLEFPPITRSLITQSGVDDTSALEGLMWKRSIAFADALKPCLFGASISSSDVEQGKLGNCGFAASLSALAVHSDLIRRLFLFPKRSLINEQNSDMVSVSGVGLYELELCHNGVWRQYTIDDLIPCNYGGTAAFATHADKSVLWVSLIEKCAAKAYGGYDRLTAFCKLNAFNDLTGCPIEEIDFSVFGDWDVLWKHLLEWNDNDLVAMTVAATVERAQKNIADLGVTGNHAFTMLRAVELEKLRLVKLRNPWGKCPDNISDRWKGDYSRYNFKQEWTQSLKEIVRPGLDDNDGSFWMKFADFVQYFHAASLCHLLVMRPQYKICRISCQVMYEYSERWNSEDVMYPKLILDLTQKSSVDRMELEWLGLQQENLRSQYAKHMEYLDLCLLIAELKYPHDQQKCKSDNPAYIKPLRITECRKSKTEFEKVFAELKGGCKYVIIPYSTGITFHKNFKALKKEQARNVNISLYIKDRRGAKLDTDVNIKLELQKQIGIKELTPILTHFVEVLGTKRKQGDLEYIRMTTGALGLTCVRHSNIGQTLSGSFSFDLVNTLPAVGFDQGFVLKNNICKKIEWLGDDQEKKDSSPPREWIWVHTAQNVKCMESLLFVMGQYERFKRQKWQFTPELYFTTMNSDKKKRSKHKPKNSHSLSTSKNHSRNYSHSREKSQSKGKWYRFGL